MDPAQEIQQNPSTSCVLVRILVKELERAEARGPPALLIPLLHTLMYTLIQAPCIPDDLCARVYDFCKRLLTLPKPFCTIGLDYAAGCRWRGEPQWVFPDLAEPPEPPVLGAALVIPAALVVLQPSLRVFVPFPGTLYHRTVISEHSLPSAPFPYQERIFIFADPELLPEAICQALLSDTEAARLAQSPGGCMSCVVTHALQAALGDSCDIHSLRARLQALSPRDVERCFQQVVAALEGAAGSERGQLTARLESIYRGLLGSVPAGNAAREGLQGTPLPNPNISFHLWTEDEQLWKELALFLRPLSQSCEPESLGQEPDGAAEVQDILGDCDCCGQSRFSVLSTDSGIERDLPCAGEPCAADPERSRLHRKGGIKKRAVPAGRRGLAAGCPPREGPGKAPRASGAAPEPPGPLQRLHTARVVLLGDDRVLGRLAQAFHSLRKREARRVFLTARLDLQFYHIPVLPGQPSEQAGPEELCEVAGYLGRADPCLSHHWQPTQKGLLHSASPSRALVTDLFLTDVIAYYARMGTQPVGFQLHSVKVLFQDPAQDPAEDVFLTELLAQCRRARPTKSLSSNGRDRRDKVGQKDKVDTRDARPLCDPGGSAMGLCSVTGRRMLTLSLRSTGLLMKAIPAEEAPGLDCLSVTITEIIRINHLAGRSVLSEYPFRTRSIKVRSPEQRPFTVRLDKDSRRTYSDVIGLEVSPCLEPSYCLQKARTMKFSPDEAEDVGLMKYLPKCLLLPINTFAGVVQ
ncbi:phosphoinositide 3-kinase regulatory subunit 6 [Sylvia atricapilla]|uniref:phosphoinositide 3-kinase regulatory subunit 6 n=1 Tax=Sylvia atricapilla TaxID=48155 RepID=UPI00339B262E